MSALTGKSIGERINFAERLKTAYKKVILRAAWFCYIRGLRKEQKKMLALADTLETSDDTSESAEALANYLSNEPEEFQQFLERTGWKHRFQL